MGNELRETGISLIGNAPWGTHFCQFYQTKEDLLEILIPYFKAGLEKNEFCMWITSEPLRAEEAEMNLRKVVKNIDYYVKKGQMEILDYSQWYTKSGKFNADEVLDGWVEKENQALKRGFEGLRLTGNTFWLEDKDWRSFTEYEEVVNNGIGNYKMLAVCSYALDKCGATEIMDVVANHQFALVKRESKWEIVESSERKQTEEALRESEELFRKAFDHAALGMVLVNLDGHYLRVNSYFCQMLGYTEEELLSKEFKDVTHPDDQHKSIEVLRQVTQDIVPFGLLEKRYLHKDGHIVWAIVSTSLVRDAVGKPLYSVTHIQNITERKRAEENLEKEFRLRTTLLDNIPDCIALILKKGTREIVASNRFARELGAVPGQTCFKTCAMRDDNCPFCLAPALWTTGQSQRLEVEYRGTWYEGIWAPLSEDLYVHYIFDITERKREEEEKARLEAQLNQVHKMEALGTMAGGVAHEINNLLTPIMINTEMVMEELPPEKPLQDNLKQIFRAGERARDIVKQILTFSRMKPLERANIQLCIVVKETAKFIRTSLPSTIEVRENITAQSDTVYAAPSQINQILMNLCTNAANAMREKGGVLEISLVDAHLDSEAASQFHDLTPGSYLKLTVSDTGHGIDDSIIPKIFNPYFTTKEVGEGTGMGLSVVHGIVINYGGEITVESEPGKGTTFHVFLPIIEAEVSPIIEPKTELPRGNERILFVDDEKTAVDAIQPMLENLGYKVTAKTSSIETLETFRNNPNAFDLVITDQTMPNMTGKELAKELMSIRPDIPILLCTGFSEQIDEKRAREIGISAYVMKPIIITDRIL